MRSTRFRLLFVALASVLLLGSTTVYLPGDGAPGPDTLTDDVSAVYETLVSFEHLPGDLWEGRTPEVLYFGRTTGGDFSAAVDRVGDVTGNCESTTNVCLWKNITEKLADLADFGADGVQILVDSGAGSYVDADFNADVISVIVPGYTGPSADSVVCQIRPSTIGTNVVLAPTGTTSMDSVFQVSQSTSDVGGCLVEGIDCPACSGGGVDDDFLSVGINGGGWGAALNGDVVVPGNIITSHENGDGNAGIGNRAFGFNLTGTGGNAIGMAVAGDGLCIGCRFVGGNGIFLGGNNIIYFGHGRIEQTLTTSGGEILRHRPAATGDGFRGKLMMARSEIVSTVTTATTSALTYNNAALAKGYQADWDLYDLSIHGFTSSRASAVHISTVGTDSHVSVRGQCLNLYNNDLNVNSDLTPIGDAGRSNTTQDDGQGGRKFQGCSVAPFYEPCTTDAECSGVSAQCNPLYCSGGTTPTWSDEIEPCLIDADCSGTGATCNSVGGTGGLLDLNFSQSVYVAGPDSDQSDWGYFGPFISATNSHRFATLAAVLTGLSRGSTRAFASRFPNFFNDPKSMTRAVFEAGEDPGCDVGWDGDLGRIYIPKAISATNAKITRVELKPDETLGTDS